MIVGGAQENTLLTCQGLARTHGDDVLLITGPSLGPEGMLLDEEQSHGFEVVEIPQLRRAINPVRDASSYFAIKRTLREFRADVVHTHSAKGGILGRMAASAIRVPAIVHTVHGAPFHPFQNWLPRTLSRWCEKYAAPKCHAVVSVADAMTDLMVDGRVAPREKFTTVYSGMDVAPFVAANDLRTTTRDELGLPPESVVIGKIARLFHLKGHEYLIEAASRVIAENANVCFLFVGDGILREQFESRIRDAGMANHFHFTGLVRPERIPSLIGAMDVLVHTSLREGLARALPQALIAGKPVVSYDVDGAREVAIPNHTGYLLPPKSVEPLADALIELAGDDKLRERLGRTGRERFTHQFRHETMTQQLREIYERLL